MTGTIDKTRDPLGYGERPADRRTEDLEGATVGHGQTQEQAEQRRLSGAVRPHQPVDLPLCRVQVDAVECDDLTEGLGDPACPDCDPCTHDSLPSQGPQEDRPKEIH
jgi:hypothetical protein